MAYRYGNVAVCLAGCLEFIEFPPIYVTCVGLCLSIYGDPPDDPADKVRMAHQGSSSMHRPDLEAIRSHHAAQSSVPKQ